MHIHARTQPRSNIAGTHCMTPAHLVWHGTPPALQHGRTMHYVVPPAQSTVSLLSSFTPGEMIAVCQPRQPSVDDLYHVTSSYLQPTLRSNFPGRDKFYDETGWALASLHQGCRGQSTTTMTGQTSPTHCTSASANTSPLSGWRHDGQC